MSEDGLEKGIVPAPSAALIRNGPAVLAKRGLCDLKLTENADQLLQKARECFSAACDRISLLLKDRRYRWRTKDKQYCALMKEYFLYLQRAVDSNPNYPKALGELAEAYLKGFGVEEDGPTALRLFCLAGEFASADELWDMSFEIASGIKFGPLRPEDMKVAERFCRRSAEQGHAGGQYNLGAMYARGGLFAHGDNGLPRDRELAMYWLRKAAENGEFPPAEDEIRHLWKSG